MPLLDERPTKRRWPRSQKFILSEKGVTAEADYRAVIVSSRSDASAAREAFDAARAGWARTWAVESDDGLYLGEVASGPKTLEQLVAALEACDKTKQDALEAVGRTFDAGLLTTAPAPAPEVTPHTLRPRRW
jgi:hypothetical protein